MQSVFSRDPIVFLLMFPRWDCKSGTEGGPIVFTFHFIVVCNGCLMFQNPHFSEAYVKSRECFIPRRDCESRTEGGPILFTFHSIVVNNRCLMFQNPNFPAAFLKTRECFIYGMDGWIGIS